MELLDTSLIGKEHINWLIAFCVAASVYIALRLLEYLVARYLSAVSKRTGKETDEFLADVLRRKTKQPILVIWALYLGSLYLTLSPKMDRAFSKIALVALILQLGIWLNEVITRWLTNWMKTKAEQDPGSASTYGVVSFIAKAALWLFILFLTLDNMGVNITTLIAGLGIGGVAIALAVQNILGDLLASISIALDKPFVVGDFITVDDLMGTVEYIGIKTTRVRSVDGEQLVFSNIDLLKSRIRNYKRMFERRVLFEIGVTYQTPYETLQVIPSMIREIISGMEKTRLDRVHFFKYGDSALIFQIVYFVLSRDVVDYMNIQEKINLAIYDRFKREGIEFAYPTRTVYSISTDTK